jgi:hypothetical protein
MQSITLLYTDAGGSPHTRDFDVYGGNISNVHFVKKNHRLLNGGWAENPVGYYYEMEIDFAPIPSKEDVFWMQGFAFGSNRQIQLNPPDNDIQSVTIDGNSLKYEFFDGVSFANGFKMNFAERGLRTITDDGNYRVFRPSYSMSHYSGNIVYGLGSEYTKFVNLCDDCSIEVLKNDLNFIDGQRDDVSFGFLHNFVIDFGVIDSAAQRTWIIEFCLWRNKRIDTTLIDPDNGRVYDVVFPDDKLTWNFDNGMHEALATTLVFQAKDLMTTPEEYLTSGDVFILDESELDSGKVLG